MGKGELGELVRIKRVIKKNFFEEMILWLGSKRRNGASHKNARRRAFQGQRTASSKVRGRKELSMFPEEKKSKEL